MSTDVCQEKNNLILLINDTSYAFVYNINKTTTFNFRKKQKTSLEKLLGMPFGTIFEVTGEGIKVLEKEPCFEDLLNKDLNEFGEITGDNREINDNNEAQELSGEEIKELKSKGVGGEELIRRIISHSKSWSKKTVFSQQKYLKKKLEKHLTLVKMLKPTPTNIINSFTLKHPQKIGGIRNDSLSYLLTWANIKANSRLLTMDCTEGLLLSSIIYRTRGTVSILNLFPTSKQPSFPALRLLNFSLPNSSNSSKAPLLSHSSLSNFEGQVGLGDQMFDAILLCCSDFDPFPLSVSLFEKSLKLSHNLVVFCAFLEPLSKLLEYFNTQKNAVNYQLVELWTRPYQVLPGRTHPEMRMDGSSGYILHATKVDSKLSLPSSTTPVNPTFASPVESDKQQTQNENKEDSLAKENEYIFSQTKKRKFSKD